MAEDHHDHRASDHRAADDHEHGPPRGYAETGNAIPGGLAIAVDGLRSEPSIARIDPDEDATSSFEVRHGGDIVRLDPYLGALGHLVALRAGDLAYLHVHPEETDPEDGVVRFAARFPTPGRYRLFLQAKPAGDLLTGSFDVTVEDS